jgi:hypothetical protein
MNTGKYQRAPSFQPRMRFESQDRRGLYHLAAAESSTGGSSSSGAAPSDEQTNTAELAKELQNPVASLISVPIQNNWDFGIGPADAMRDTANVQPVIPLSPSPDRSILP